MNYNHIYERNLIKKKGPYNKKLFLNLLKDF